MDQSFLFSAFGSILTVLFSALVFFARQLSLDVTTLQKKISELGTTMKHLSNSLEHINSRQEGFTHDVSTITSRLAVLEQRIDDMRDE